jgi:hypothetical protein
MMSNQDWVQHDYYRQTARAGLKPRETSVWHRGKVVGRIRSKHHGPIHQHNRSCRRTNTLDLSFHSQQRNQAFARIVPVHQLAIERGLTNSAMNPRSSFDPTPSIRPGEAALEACPTTPSMRRVNRAT